MCVRVCLCVPLAYVCMSPRVPAQLHLEYLFQTVCVMCMTSLSEGAYGGYTNTEEGYLYLRKLWWFLSDLAYSGLIWLGHGLILTFFWPTQRNRIVLILNDCQWQPQWPNSVSLPPPQMVQQYLRFHPKGFTALMYRKAGWGGVVGGRALSQHTGHVVQIWEQHPLRPGTMTWLHPG